MGMAAPGVFEVTEVQILPLRLPLVHCEILFAINTPAKACQISDKQQKTDFLVK
jgi:hypothetical protein